MSEIKWDYQDEVLGELSYYKIKIFEKVDFILCWVEEKSELLEKRM